MSAADVPTSNSNSPASAFQPWMAGSQNENDRSSNPISTVVDAPASRCTRAKPLSSFSGRTKLDSTSRTYSCTTQSPARPPVLLTGTDTVSPWPALVVLDEVVAWPIEKVVYDRPK